MNWQILDASLQEMAEFQQKKLLKLAQQVIPYLTSDDILQPNDFPLLENHPVFRYEEGILAGIQSAQIALRAYVNDQVNI